MPCGFTVWGIRCTPGDPKGAHASSGRTEPPVGRWHPQLQAYPLCSSEGGGPSKAVPRPAAGAPPGLQPHLPSAELCRCGRQPATAQTLQVRLTDARTALRHNSLSLHQCPGIFLVTGIKHDSCKILAADYICLFNCMQNACQEDSGGSFCRSIPPSCTYPIQLFGDALRLPSKLQGYKPFYKHPPLPHSSSNIGK